MSESAVADGSLDDVTDEQWEALGSRRVFFGHQSVGENIVDGVRELLAGRPQIPLRVVTSENPARVDGPALIEARIGENRRPETKSEAFERILERGFGHESGAIAMYKYCYVDVLPETDPEQLFEAYARHAESLRRRHPGVTLAHVTIPLTTAPDGLWERARTALGLKTATRLNLARERFNELLRERCGTREPVFDLALVESVRPDGTRATTPCRGREVPMLAPEWTHDGGHLDEEGRLRVAEQFLIFLADVAGRGGRSPDTTGTAAAENRI